jgi:excisionase family DNA binding protein
MERSSGTTRPKYGRKRGRPISSSRREPVGCERDQRNHELKPNYGEGSKAITSRSAPNGGDTEIARLLQRMAEHMSSARRCEAASQHLLTPMQVATRLGISRTQAYRLISQMNYVRVGDRGLRISEHALAEYIERHTEQPACPKGSTARRKGVPGTARTTTPKESGSRPASKPETRKPRASPCGASNAKRTLRLVYPSTRPRDR